MFQQHMCLLEKCNAIWESYLQYLGKEEEEEMEMDKEEGGGDGDEDGGGGGVVSTWTECCTKCLSRLRSQILWVQVTADAVLSFTSLNVFKR